MKTSDRFRRWLQVDSETTIKILGADLFEEAKTNPRLLRDLEDLYREALRRIQIMRFREKAGRQ